MVVKIQLIIYFLYHILHFYTKNQKRVKTTTFFTIIFEIMMHNLFFLFIFAFDHACLTTLVFNTEGGRMKVKGTI